METSSVTLKIRAFAALAILSLAPALFFSCSSARVKQSDGATPVSSSGTPMGPEEEYGPEPTQPPLTYGPEPVQLHPITVVFGPGMARGLAHVGVLRSLVQNKIPIAAVYGVEMGSLIAALYAMDSNINHFEWALMKFKDDVFVPQKGILNKFFERTGSAAKLEQQLTSVFGRKNIADARIPLRIAIQQKDMKQPRVIEQGEVASAVRAAMSYPGVFDAGSWDGAPAVAASSPASVALLCEEARASGAGPILLIDTGVSQVDPSAADLVIRPDLGGMGALDFQMRTDAAYRGRKAIEDHLDEIRKKVGLSSS